MKEGFVLAYTSDVRSFVMVGKSWMTSGREEMVIREEASWPCIHNQAEREMKACTPLISLRILGPEPQPMGQCFHLN